MARGADAAPVRFPDANTGDPEMTRLMALALLAMFSMGVLSACNTTKGFGQDVQKVGEKVEDKAQDCKDGRC